MIGYQKNEISVFYLKITLIFIFEGRARVVFMVDDKLMGDSSEL